MLQTETTVQTNTKREDRFGGFSTTENRTKTLFEPDFQPFTFGDEIPASSETAFEVEKQYTFDTTSYTQQEQQREMSQPTVQKSYETEIVASKEAQIVAHKDAQIVAKAKLNARGKILVSVYSIIVAIIVAFCVYSGVIVANLGSDISAKQQIVASQTQVISQLQDAYNSLGEDDAIISQVGDEFKVPTIADTVSVSDFEIMERPEAKEETNWFEKFCESLKKLFS